MLYLRDPTKYAYNSAFGFELTLRTAKNSSDVGAIRAYMPSYIVISYD
jgi:hypothetical protein